MALVSASDPAKHHAATVQSKTAYSNDVNEFYLACSSIDTPSALHTRLNVGSAVDGLFVDHIDMNTDSRDCWSNQQALGVGLRHGDIVWRLCKTSGWHTRH